MSGERVPPADDTRPNRDANHWQARVPDRSAVAGSGAESFEQVRMRLARLLPGLARDDLDELAARSPRVAHARSCPRHWDDLPCRCAEVGRYPRRERWANVARTRRISRMLDAIVYGPRR